MPEIALKPGIEYIVGRDDEDRPAAGTVIPKSDQRRLVHLESHHQRLMVSRKHARISCAAGATSWRVVDQDSTNGLQHNGRRVKEADLKDGVHVCKRAFVRVLDTCIQFSEMVMAGDELTFGGCKDVKLYCSPPSTARQSIYTFTFHQGGRGAGGEDSDSAESSSSADEEIDAAAEDDMAEEKRLCSNLRSILKKAVQPVASGSASYAAPLTLEKLKKSTSLFLTDSDFAREKKAAREMGLSKPSLVKGDGRSWFKFNRTEFRETQLQNEIEKCFDKVVPTLNTRSTLVRKV